MSLHLYFVLVSVSYVCLFGDCGIARVLRCVVLLCMYTL